MTSGGTDLFVKPADWVKIVCRARIGESTKGVGAKMVKAVACRLAWYADFNDGTKVFPGPARMAVELEMDYKTVKKAYAVLRSFDLILLVAHGRGVRPAGVGDDEIRSDEYRLNIPADLLERLRILDPTELVAAAKAVAAANSGRNRIAGPQVPRNGRRAPAADPVDNTSPTVELGATRVPPITGPKPAADDRAQPIAGTFNPDAAELRGLSGVHCGERETRLPTSDLPRTSINHDHSCDRDSLPSTGEPVEDPDFDDEPTKIGALFGAGLPLRQTECGNPLCHGGTLHIGINRRPCPKCNPAA